MNRPTLLTLCLAIAASLAGCDVPGCTPTHMDARNAGVVDLTKPTSSSVLQARLTADKAGVADVTVEFFFSDRLLGTDVTDGRGFARLDLKGQPLTLLRGLDGEEYFATFVGDGTYCSAGDEGALKLIKK